MSDEFVWFRSTSTGKVGKYPERFGSRPSFERIDPNEAQCVDCWVVAPSDSDDDELIDLETGTFGPSENVLDPEDEDQTENEDN